MDWEKVNRLKDEIRNLSREEFHHVRALVDTIVCEANRNPNYWKSAEQKQNSVGAEMVRRMIAAFENQ